MFDEEKQQYVLKDGTRVNVEVISAGPPERSLAEIVQNPPKLQLARPPEGMTQVSPGLWVGDRCESVFAREEKVIQATPETINLFGRMTGQIQDGLCEICGRYEELQKGWGIMEDTFLCPACQCDVQPIEDLMPRSWLETTWVRFKLWLQEWF